MCCRQHLQGDNTTCTVTTVIYVDTGRTAVLQSLNCGNATPLECQLLQHRCTGTSAVRLHITVNNRNQHECRCWQTPTHLPTHPSCSDRSFVPCMCLTLHQKLDPGHPQYLWQHARQEAAKQYSSVERKLCLIWVQRQTGHSQHAGPVSTIFLLRAEGCRHCSIVLHCAWPALLALPLPPPWPLAAPLPSPCWPTYIHNQHQFQLTTYSTACHRSQLHP